MRLQRLLKGSILIFLMVISIGVWFIPSVEATDSLITYRNEPSVNINPSNIYSYYYNESNLYLSGFSVGAINLQAYRQEFDFYNPNKVSLPELCASGQTGKSYWNWWFVGQLLTRYSGETINPDLGLTGFPRSLYIRAIGNCSGYKVLQTTQKGGMRMAVVLGTDPAELSGWNSSIHWRFGNDYTKLDVYLNKSGRTTFKVYERKDGGTLFGGWQFSCAFGQEYLFQVLFNTTIVEITFGNGSVSYQHDYFQNNPRGLKTIFYEAIQTSYWGYLWMMIHYIEYLWGASRADSSDFGWIDFNIGYLDMYAIHNICLNFTGAAQIFLCDAPYVVGATNLYPISPYAYYWSDNRIKYGGIHNYTYNQLATRHLILFFYSCPYNVFSWKGITLNSVIAIHNSISYPFAMNNSDRGDCRTVFYVKNSILCLELYSNIRNDLNIVNVSVQIPFFANYSQFLTSMRGTMSDFAFFSLDSFNGTVLFSDKFPLVLQEVSWFIELPYLTRFITLNISDIIITEPIRTVKIELYPILVIQYAETNFSMVLLMSAVIPIILIYIPPLLLGRIFTKKLFIPIFIGMNIITFLTGLLPFWVLGVNLIVGLIFFLKFRTEEDL